MFCWENVLEVVMDVIVVKVDDMVFEILVWNEGV